MASVLLAPILLLDPPPAATHTRHIGEKSGMMLFIVTSSASTSHAIVALAKHLDPNNPRTRYLTRWPKVRMKYFIVCAVGFGLANIQHRPEWLQKDLDVLGVANGQWNLRETGEQICCADSRLRFVTLVDSSYISDTSKRAR